MHEAKIKDFTFFIRMLKIPHEWTHKLVMNLKNAGVRSIISLTYKDMEKVMKA